MAAAGIAGGLAGQGIAVGGAAQGALHHELGLEGEFAAAVPDLDRLEIAAQVEAVTVCAVHGCHPGVVHLFVLLQQQIALHGHRQPVLQNQAAALAADLRVATRQLLRHHALRVQPRLRRGVRIVGEGHPIAAPACGGDGELGGLEAPAVHSALHQLLRAGGVEAADLLGLGLPVGFRFAGLGVGGGYPYAAFQFQAAHVAELADPLIHGRIDGLLPQPLLLAGRDRLRWCRSCVGARRRRRRGWIGWPHGHTVQLLRQGARRAAAGAIRIRAAAGGRHGHREPLGWSLAKAVAKPHQVGIAAFTHAAVGAVGAGAVMDASHQRPFRRHQGLHLEAQVVEEGGVVLAVGLLVVAHRCVQAHALHKAQAEPGLHPQPQPQATGDFTEGLRRRVGEGHRLVEFAARLGIGVVAHQVGIKFQGQRSGFDQSLVEAHPQQVFRAQAPVEQEGVAEVGIDHLPSPERGRPGMGMPVRDRRQRWRAGHSLGRRRQGDRRHAPGRAAQLDGLAARGDGPQECAARRRWAEGLLLQRRLGAVDARAHRRPGAELRCGRRQRARRAPVAEWRQGHRGRLGQIQINFGGVQVENAVDVVQFADVLDQAVAQFAGLEILLTPLEAHPAAGVNRAGAGFVLDPIGQQAAARHLGHHLARGYEAIQLLIESLAVGAELDREGWALLGSGSAQTRLAGRGLGAARQRSGLDRSGW